MHLDEASWIATVSIIVGSGPSLKGNSPIQWWSNFGLMSEGSPMISLVAYPLMCLSTP
jgi:hypothetical protein